MSGDREWFAVGAPTEKGDRHPAFRHPEAHRVGRAGREPVPFLLRRLSGKGKATESAFHRNGAQPAGEVAAPCDG